MNKRRRFWAFLVVLLAFFWAASTNARSTANPTEFTLGSRYERYTSLAEAMCDDPQGSACVIRADLGKYPVDLVQGRTRRELAISACERNFSQRLAIQIQKERKRTLVDLLAGDSSVRANPVERARCRTAMQRPEFQERMAAADRQFMLAIQRRTQDAQAAVPNGAASSAPPVASSAPPSVVADPVPRTTQDPPADVDVAKDDNPYKDESKPAAPKPAVKYGFGPSGLGEDLVLLYANAREAAIYIKPGGQFYTIRASYLAKKYETDWVPVFTYDGNEYQDMFGACFQGTSVRLDPNRMHVRSWDSAKLTGPVNQSFMDQCRSEGGEFRFALQAGQIIKIPAKGRTGTGASASGSPPAPKAVAPIVPAVPAPSVTAATPTPTAPAPTAPVVATPAPVVTAVPTTSPEDSSAAAAAPVTTSSEPVESAASVEDAGTSVLAPIVPEMDAAEPDAEVRQDAGVPVSHQRSNPRDWNWLANLLLVVLGIALVVMMAMGIRNWLKNHPVPDTPDPGTASGSDPPPPPPPGDDDDDDDDGDPGASAPGPAPPASGSAPPTGGAGPPGASAGTYGPPQPGPDPRRTRKFSFPADPNAAAPPVDPDQQGGIFTPPRRDHVKTPKRSVQFPNYGADPDAATVQHRLPGGPADPDPDQNEPPDAKSGVNS